MGKNPKDKHQKDGREAEWLFAQLLLFLLLRNHTPGGFKAFALEEGF